MAGDDKNVDKALAHVEPAKRAFLKALLTGTAFAAPVVTSFSMKGLSNYEVHAMAGSNVSVSDRNRKEAFAAVDSAVILNRVANLPIGTWRYKGETLRHIGPMAQDFAAAFNVGPDDRHIDLLDASGVALAAIQALARQVAAQNAEIAAMKSALDQRPHHS